MVRAAQQTRDTSLLDEIGRLRLVVTRLSRQMRQRSEGGLTPTQHAALSAVSRLGPLTLGALAEAESVARPSVTRVVDKLEALGLIERRRSARDRRSADVMLTAAGSRYLDEVKIRKAAWLAGQVHSLGLTDVNRIRDVSNFLELLLEREPR